MRNSACQLVFGSSRGLPPQPPAVAFPGLIAGHHDDHGLRIRTSNFRDVAWAVCEWLWCNGIEARDQVAQLQPSNPYRDHRTAPTRNHL